MPLVQTGVVAAVALILFLSLGQFAMADPGGQVSITEAGQAQEAEQKKSPTTKPKALERFEIDEYRVQGAKALEQIVVEEAVYPFLGPNRTPEDVEKARAALEKVYHDQGYQAVVVSIPQQNASTGVITLVVSENRVGRVRVKGARYYDPDTIKRGAPAVVEGKIVNFNDVTKDIVGLNQWPDRRVTPALKAGVAPGTVDIDLNVEDKVPFHGNVEFNNRQSPGTTPFRITSTLHYDNLWQLGNSFSFTYQVAPERVKDAQVFSASYLVRIPEFEYLSLLMYGLKSNSDVATIGGTDVVGPGEIAGARIVMTLPTRENFFHTVSFGADYKHFEQVVGDNVASDSTPVTYVPIVLSYNASWQTEGALTQLTAGATFGLRGIGSSPAEFDAKRYNAQGNFIHVNADVSHTHDLPEGFQIYGRLAGQLSDQPLVSSEQSSLGGLDTVRGYLESEVLADDSLYGTLEFRSPNLGPMLTKALEDNGTHTGNFFNEWRFFGFADGATSFIHDPLSEQQAHFDLWSYGIGTKFKLSDYFNGMVVLSVPMISQTYTQARDPRMNFRVWGEF